MNETSVVHLVWQPAGTEPLKRFLDSYREFQPGLEHELVVVFNGFSGTDMAEHRELLAHTPHRELRIDGRVRDLAAYFWAARQLESRYVCFVNSYSTPLVPDWLATLRRHVADPGVGAAGATGSWESFYSSYLDRLAEHPRPRPLRWLWSPYQRWKVARYAANFQPVPNPHLRSNAFLIERSRWLSLEPPRLESKWDTWLFESGRRGMTAQLLAQRQQVLVVGRDGRGYRPDEWRDSATFRAGEQRNLLIADNRTRDYDDAGPEERAFLSRLAWHSD